MPKEQSLYSVAESCNIGPRALVRLLDAGLPHTKDEEGLGILADREAVQTWLGTLHEVGKCGQMLAWLEAGADWSSLPAGVLRLKGGVS